MRYFGVWPEGVASRSGTSGPSVGWRACHTDVDDFPRVQFAEEKRQERTKEEISDLEKITGPDFSRMSAEERRPLLPTWRQGGERASCSSEWCVCTRVYPA
jgi:hypothetical protein